VRLRVDRPHRVERADREGRDADRQEDAQRAEDGDDPQEDEEELRAVARELDLRRPRRRSAAIGTNATL
jgi:hypothetical protein